MTTTLNLDAPGASEALAKCYRLLRQWAVEARLKEATDRETCDPGRSAADAVPDDGRNEKEVNCPMDKSND